MKQPYEAMKIEVLGTVGTVINKSGDYRDASQNFDLHPQGPPPHQ
jgi:hypothetical protein